MQKRTAAQLRQILMQSGNRLHILPGTLMPLGVLIRCLPDGVPCKLHFLFVQTCPQIHQLLGYQRILCFKYMGRCSVHNGNFPVLQYHCIQGLFVGGAVIPGHRLIGKRRCNALHQRGFSCARSSLQYVCVEVRAQNLFGKVCAESIGCDTAEEIRLLHNSNLPSDMFYLMQNR